MTGQQCRKAKRPITAIREAASDGNPATTPDLTWSPLIDTPGFPEFHYSKTIIFLENEQLK